MSKANNKIVKTKEIKVRGIVYKITNTVNNKIYIGKTKTHYGNKSFGIEQRLSNHIAHAKKGDSRGCPALTNAIIKHGKDNFIIEELLRCKLKYIDKYEIEQIQLHDSTNKKKGYNIAMGGGGRSVVEVSEETRAKISKKEVNKMNLAKVYRNEIHVGYTVRRREKGVQYQKWFTSTKNTPAENRKLAVQWLKDFRENKVAAEADYNKESGLPRNIYVKKEKGIQVGYSLNITRNGVTVAKTFQSKTIPLEELLEKAIKFKEDYLKKISEQVKIDE